MPLKSPITIINWIPASRGTGSIWTKLGKWKEIKKRRLCDGIFGGIAQLVPTCSAEDCNFCQVYQASFW